MSDSASPDDKKTGGMSWSFQLILLSSALYIAGCSAFFSVRGLGLLFVGSEIPVMVMAASLEVGKLVAASFLYRYWDRVNGALRFYLSLAVVLLIAITSLGNYGFLARAYEKTTTQIQRNELEIAALEKDIADTQRQIDDSRGRTNRFSSATREDIAKAQARLTQAQVALDASLGRLQEQRKSINERRSQELAAPTQRASQQGATLSKSIAAEEATVASLNDRIKVLDQAVSAYTVQGTTSQLIFFEKDNVRRGQELRTEQKPEREGIAAKLAETATRIERLRSEQNRIGDSSGKETANLRQQFDADLTKVDAEEKNLRRTGAENITSLEHQLSALGEQGQGKVSMTEAEIDKLRQSVAARNTQIHDLRDQIAAADIGSYRFVARAFEAEADDVVKWLMLALVAVFDPLAVTLVVAFNMAAYGRRPERAATPEAPRPGKARPWVAWEITLVVVLLSILALILAWLWSTDTPFTSSSRSNRSSAGMIPGDSFAVFTLRPDEFRQKTNKAFPAWLERTGGKGMSAAFAELLKNGLDPHTDIFAFAKFPSTSTRLVNYDRPVILCGAVLRVTDPVAAEAALSRIADQMNNLARGDSDRPTSNLTRNRAMVRHGEGRYMDPEGGFFTFGLTNQTALILVEFEGNPLAPCVEQEMRRCLARTSPATATTTDRLPADVSAQPGALTLWVDAERFFARLPMSASTRQRSEQLQPSLNFELLLSLNTAGSDTLKLEGNYRYHFDRFTEGKPRDPLAIIAKLPNLKNADLGWKLVNRCVDTLDYDAIIERLRGALGDDKSPGSQQVLVEKSIPTARTARFSMKAHFDAKSGPPLLAALTLLAP